VFFGEFFHGTGIVLVQYVKLADSTADSQEGSSFVPVVQETGYPWRSVVFPVPNTVSVSGGVELA